MVGGVILYARKVLIRNSSVFDEMIAFPAPELQPHYTTTFCMKFVELIYIECQSLDHMIPNLLDDNPRLGAHAEVWLVVRGKVERFVWFHQVIKPNGLASRHQCSKCGGLGDLRVTIEKTCVKWSCHAIEVSNGEKCGHVMVEEIPVELQNLGTSPCGRGAWKLVVDRN